MAVGTREQWEPSRLRERRRTVTRTRSRSSSSPRRSHGSSPLVVERSGGRTSARLPVRCADFRHPLLGGRLRSRRAQPVMDRQAAGTGVPLFSPACDRHPGLPADAVCLAARRRDALLEAPARAHLTRPDPSPGGRSIGMQMAPPVEASLHMQLTDEQNAAFYDLLRRYAPLFPQKSDEAPAQSPPPRRRVFVTKAPPTRCHAARLRGGDATPLPRRCLVLDSTNTERGPGVAVILWSHSLMRTEKAAPRRATHFFSDDA